jgi:hypothetical protein
MALASADEEEFSAERWLEARQISDNRVLDAIWRMSTLTANYNFDDIAFSPALAQTRIDLLAAKATGGRAQHGDAWPPTSSAQHRRSRNDLGVRHYIGSRRNRRRSLCLLFARRTDLERSSGEDHL